MIVVVSALALLGTASPSSRSQDPVRVEELATAGSVSYDEAATAEALRALSDVLQELEPKAAEFRSDRYATNVSNYRDAEKLIATRREEIDRIIGRFRLIHENAARASGLNGNRARKHADTLGGAVFQEMVFTLSTGDEGLREFETELPVMVRWDKSRAHLEQTLEALEPVATAIRSDESLSLAAREAQLRALLIPYQDRIDVFLRSFFNVSGFRRDGDTQDDADRRAETWGQLFVDAMLRGFVLGTPVESYPPGPWFDSH